MRVLLFARARELAGADVVDIALPSAATVGELRRALTNRYGQLTGLVARSAIAVNGAYAEDALTLPLNAEVAVVPPVSGG